MNSLNKQGGALDLQLMLLLLMAGFLIVCAAKIVPAYMDNWTIMEAMDGVQAEINPKSIKKHEIMRSLSARLVVNRIEDVTEKTIKFSRTAESLKVSSPYEKRIPLMFNIDVVIKFPNTGFEVPLSGG